MTQKITENIVNIQKLLFNVSALGICTELGQKKLKEFNRIYSTYSNMINSQLLSSLPAIHKNHESTVALRQCLHQTDRVVHKFFQTYQSQYSNEIKFAKDYGNLIATVFSLNRMVQVKSKSFKRLCLLKAS